MREVRALDLSRFYAYRLAAALANEHIPMIHFAKRVKLTPPVWMQDDDFAACL
jgi:hypothetical protein